MRLAAYFALVRVFKGSARYALRQSNSHDPVCIVHLEPSVVFLLPPIPHRLGRQLPPPAVGGTPATHPTTVLPLSLSLIGHQIYPATPPPSHLPPNRTRQTASSSSPVMSQLASARSFVPVFSEILAQPRQGRRSSMRSSSCPIFGLGGID